VGKVQVLGVLKVWKRKNGQAKKPKKHSMLDGQT